MTTKEEFRKLANAQDFKCRKTSFLDNFVNDTVVTLTNVTIQTIKAHNYPTNILLARVKMKIIFSLFCPFILTPRSFLLKNIHMHRNVKFSIIFCKD